MYDAVEVSLHLYRPMRIFRTRYRLWELLLAGVLLPPLMALFLLLLSASSGMHVDHGYLACCNRLQDVYGEIEDELQRNPSITEAELQAFVHGIASCRATSKPYLLRDVKTVGSSTAESDPRIIACDAPGNHPHRNLTGNRILLSDPKREKVCALLSDGSVATMDVDSARYEAWAEGFVRGAENLKSLRTIEAGVHSGK